MGRRGRPKVPGEEAMKRWWVPTREHVRVLATIAPALVTYVMSAVGVYYAEFTLVVLDAGRPSLFSAPFGVAIFTLSHAALILGMGFGRSLDHRFGFMGWLCLAGVCGIPILILAVETSLLSLLGFLVHVLRTRRGTRLWVFLEYGSSAVCLLLFRAFYQDLALFPWALPALVFQVGVLLALARIARPMWVDDP